MFRLTLLILVGSLLASAQNPDRGPLNNELPAWLTLGVFQRVRFENQADIALNAADDDGFLVEMLHLDASIQPHSKLEFFVQGQDSRVSGLNPGFPRGNQKDRLDLRQGYVKIGDGEDWGWDLTVGRQELILGYERLIGVNRWANLPRTWDMARLGLQRGRDRLELFAASVVIVNPRDFDEVQPGSNVHGAHAEIRSLFPHHSFQPHAIWRTRPRATDERGVTSDSDIWTFGFHLADDHDGAWDYNMDLEVQRGDFAADQLRAWRFVGLAGRTWADRPWRPRLATEYTFASGDERRGDGRIGRFDTLPARAHRIWGITDQVGGRNAKIWQQTLDLKPHPKLALGIDHFYYWLATPTDNLYRHNGRLFLTLPADNTATYIGDEIDVQATWTMSRYLSFGGGIGRLFSGPVIDRQRPQNPNPLLGFAFVQWRL